MPLCGVAVRGDDDVWKAYRMWSIECRGRPELIKMQRAGLRKSSVLILLGFALKTMQSRI